MTMSVRPHDFHRSESLDRHYVRALSVAFEAFARHASVELSTLLRKSSQISLASATEKQWHEVTALLGEQPYLVTFALDPLPGQAILSTSLATAFRLIDFRLGGGNASHFTGHSTPTDTDLAILAGIVGPLLEKLAGSLSRLREVTASIVAQDSSLQFVQLTGPTEMFLVVTFALGVAEDEPVEVMVAVPFPLVRLLTEAMRSGTLPEEGGSQVVVDPDVVLQTPIRLWVEIPPVDLTPEEISDIAVGDVIRLFHPLKQPLDVRAEGILVARGQHGHVGSKIVCSITEEVVEDDR